MKLPAFAMACALAVPFAGDAQDYASVEKNKGYFSIGGGLSVPMGDYGSSSFTNENAGMATTGWLIDLSFARKFSANVGLAATGRYVSHAFNEGAVDSYIEQNIPGATASTDADAWTATSFLGGFYFSFPMTAKATFDMKAQAGVSIAESPAFRITMSSMGTSDWIAQGSGNGSGFAWLIAAGSKINTGPRTCLIVQADYMSTRITFDGVEATSSSGGYNKGSFEQTIASFNIGIGIGFRL